ncbi:MAG TPA: hypothetical protein VL986_06170, partial [Terracidiphilus sp.]|nr:hypothetical protein [Terracidiphilus sp.]
MRNPVRLASFITLLCLAASLCRATPPAPQKNAPGTITIVFKDGHHQTYNLSDIERVEFGGNGGVAASSDSGVGPSRGHFLGKWEVGDGSGNNFYITLYEDGGAYRSLRAVHGRWEYVNGEARITWDDGAQDAIRKVGSQFQKFAYSSGKL